MLENPNLRCQVRFHKRGWVSKEICKCDGEVYEEGTGGKSKKKRMLYRIHGNWNGSIYVTKFLPDQFDKGGKVDESTTMLVYKKNPYPDKWEYMYGLSHFCL